MRTAQEIIDQTNALARKYYAIQGYKVHKGYRFDRAGHPQELALWRMACIAQRELTDTDPEDALEELGEE